MHEGNLDDRSGVSACPARKAVGAFVGVAAGDALGWPQEIPRKTVGSKARADPSERFREWARRVGWRGTAHIERVRHGEYSDDTQLTLAVARSRLVGRDEWLRTFTRTELPLWTLYERGGGGATKRAAASWLKGIPPWSRASLCEKYFEAGGNGVAMRVIPHAVSHAGSSAPNRLIRDVVADGVSTHGHARALVGAAAIAFAAWWLLRVERTVNYGELLEVVRENSSVWGTFAATEACETEWSRAATRTLDDAHERQWQTVTEELVDLLGIGQHGLEGAALASDEEVLDRLGCFGKAKGSGTISAAAALYLFSRYAANPVPGVLTAAFAYGADTDTLASMVGGLAGSLVGIEGIPRAWQQVQDRDYIVSIAERVANSSLSRSNLPVEPLCITARQTNEIRKFLDSESTEVFELDGIRQARVESVSHPRNLSKQASTRTWALRTTDGQLLYVNKTVKSPASPQPATASPLRPERPVPQLSENTKAILLLTAPLVKSDGELRSQLLTAQEYGSLAQRLQELSAQPSALLVSHPARVIRDLSDQLSPLRVESLLAREEALKEALERWRDLGVWVLSRADAEYPRKLKRRLRRTSPSFLFGSGSRGILSRTAIAVIGEDCADKSSAEYSKRAGELSGGGGRALLSQLLTDLDRVAVRGAVEAGGHLLLVGPSSTAKSVLGPDSARLMQENRIATVGVSDPTLGSVHDSRQDDCRVLFALADLALVVEALPNQGCSWKCAMEVLDAPRRGEVFIRNDDGRSEGLRLLRHRGARFWPDPQTGDKLDRLVMEIARSTANRGRPPTALDESSLISSPTGDTETRDHRGNSRSLADELLRFVAKLLEQLPATPKGAAEISEELGVDRVQAERWIRSLVNSGVLEEFELDRTYRIIRSRAQAYQSVDESD